MMIAVTIMGGACTYREEPSHYETRIAEEESNPEAGLTFSMDNDSLEEETEEIWLRAENWGEENMGVDL